jgi:hypothetical protein
MNDLEKISVVHVLRMNDAMMGVYTSVSCALTERYKYLKVYPEDAKHNWSVTKVDLDSKPRVR